MRVSENRKIEFTQKSDTPVKENFIFVRIQSFRYFCIAVTLR